MSDEQLRVDELVSAYLDGEASPAEIAEIENSDALSARVEEFRAVRHALVEPVTPLSADRRNDLIGAALGVADAEAGLRRTAKVMPFRRPQPLLLAMGRRGGPARGRRRNRPDRQQERRRGHRHRRARTSRDGDRADGRSRAQRHHGHG